jgi:hypothetical protein
MAILRTWCAWCASRTLVEQREVSGEGGDSHRICEMHAQILHEQIYGELPEWKLPTIYSVATVSLAKEGIKGK